MSNFLHSWWPWIIGGLIPQLLVALSTAPTGTGLVDAVKVILQIFSVLHHSDEPGVFKLPLVTSAAHQRIVGKIATPPEPPPPAEPPVPPAATALALVIGLIKLLFVIGIVTLWAAVPGGCSWLRAHEAALKPAIDCTIEAVRNDTAKLIPAAEEMLQGGFSEDAILNALKTLLPAGEDAIACTMQEAAVELEQVSLGPAPADATTPKAMRGAAKKMMERSHDGSVKARTIIERQGWHYATAQPTGM